MMVANEMVKNYRQERCDVSKHEQLDLVFNIMLGLTAKNRQPVTRGSSHERPLMRKRIHATTSTCYCPPISAAISIVGDMQGWP